MVSRLVVEAQGVGARLRQERYPSSEGAEKLDILTPLIVLEVGLRVVGGGWISFVSVAVSQ